MDLKGNLHMKIKDVAKELKVSEETVRHLIRTQNFDWGFAIKKEDSSRYQYVIVEKLFRKFVERGWR